MNEFKIRQHALDGLKTLNKFWFQTFGYKLETVIASKLHSDNDKEYELLAVQQNPDSGEETFISLGYSTTKRINDFIAGKKRLSAVQKSQIKKSEVKEHKIKEDKLKIKNIYKKWFVYLINEKLMLETAIVNDGKFVSLLRGTPYGDDVIYLGNVEQFKMMKV